MVTEQESDDDHLNLLQSTEGEDYEYGKDESKAALTPSKGETDEGNKASRRESGIMSSPTLNSSAEISTAESDTSTRINSMLEHSANKSKFESDPEIIENSVSIVELSDNDGEEVSSSSSRQSIEATYSTSQVHTVSQEEYDLQSAKVASIQSDLLKVQVFYLLHHLLVTTCLICFCRML